MVAFTDLTAVLESAIAAELTWLSIIEVEAKGHLPSTLGKLSINPCINLILYTASVLNNFVGLLRLNMTES